MRGQGPEFFWLIVLAISLAIAILVAKSNSRSATEERSKAAKFRTDADGLRTEVSQLKANHAKEILEKDFRFDGLTRILSERKSQFPWLASAIADFHALEVERDAKVLTVKKHPALKSAEIVREHGRKRRDAERQFRIMRYRTEYYEKLFSMDQRVHWR